MRIALSLLLAASVHVALADPPSATWICARPDGSKLTQTHPCSDGEAAPSEAPKSEFDRWLDQTVDGTRARQQTLCRLSGQMSSDPARRYVFDDCNGL